MLKQEAYTVPLVQYTVPLMRLLPMVADDGFM